MGNYINEEELESMNFLKDRIYQYSLINISIVIVNFLIWK